MTAHEVFVDTNIIVYAHDISAGEKHTMAKEIVDGFWNAPVPPNISIQVLQECAIQLEKKKIPAAEVSGMIEDYLHWNVVVNDQHILLDGLHLKDKLGISFWDAMIVAAAKKSTSKYILSEDFQHHRLYEGIKVVNPFKT